MMPLPFPLCETLTDLPGYVTHQTVLQRLGDDVCQIQLVQFQSARFEISAFEHANIHMPDWICRCVPKRQAEYFFGRLAAALSLSNIGSHDINVGTGTMKEPLFPSGIKGSISHTDTFAAAVVTSRKYNALGIDIESSLQEKSIDSVEKLVLCAAERTLILRESQWSYETLLALIFSAKETFYKATATSVGRFFGFSALQLQNLDWENCQANFLTTEHLSEHWPLGFDVNIEFQMLKNHQILTALAW